VGKRVETIDRLVEVAEAVLLPRTAVGVGPRLAAGMDDYLAKPIQTDELVQTIARLVPVADSLRRRGVLM
jgi:CheY-like chemotaxis protein